MYKNTYKNIHSIPHCTGMQTDQSRTCVVCAKAATKTCAACKKQRYCGRECQRSDWPRHRRACGRQRRNVDPDEVADQLDHLVRSGDHVTAPPIPGCPWSRAHHLHDCEFCRAGGATQHTRLGDGAECDYCMPCPNEECQEEFNDVLRTHGENSTEHLAVMHCVEACHYD